MIGDLPGWLDSDTSGSGVINKEAYVEALSEEWSRLIASDVFYIEKNAQKFLERHPSLVPGASGPTMRTGWIPWPAAVFTQPILPGLSERQPDFMWIATDSAYLMPICVEIERPDKKWFNANGNVQHSDLTTARSQVAAWRGWFADPHNAASFTRIYQVPRDMAERVLRPYFIIIHGRRSEFDGNPRTQRLRATLTAPLSDEILMTFDALKPDVNALPFGTVGLTRDGAIHAISAPATFSFPSGYSNYVMGVQGWEKAISESLDLSESAKRELIDSLESIQSRPPGIRFSVARRRST